MSSSKIFFFICFIFLTLKSFSQLESQSLFNTKIKENVVCFRIPAIACATNGDIIVAVDERTKSCGDLRHEDDINIVIRRSEDNGKTWSEIKTIIDYPIGESASDPSFIVDKITGEIFLFFNYMNLKFEKDIYYLKFVKSSDNGNTWTKPIDITNQISKPEWHNNFKFITSGEGFQTESGKLLHTLVNLEQGLFVFASDDHGKSWYLIDTPIKPADESKIIELASDKSWLINSRVNSSGYRYIHKSFDEGKTWTSKPDSSLIDPSCNASLVQYTYYENNNEKNVLIFSNLHSSSNRENLSLKYSLDNGKNWSKPKIIYQGQAAYSSLCILKNGELALVFEKDNYSDIVFCSFLINFVLAE